MYEDLFKAFDSWEPLYKARKAKGLAKWDRLTHLATKLKDKHSKHITFTSGHPTRGGKKTLGSVEGNAHFMLGYGNPGFHMAPYHWQIIYPELSDEEAEELNNKHGHPAKPELWDKSGKKVKAEGDPDEGTPHPYGRTKMGEQDADKRRMPAKSKYGTYVADVGERLVYGKHNKHVYKWDLIKDSFFASDNPDIAEAMEKGEPEVRKSLYLPEPVKHLCTRRGAFSEDVYPLVKSIFPTPGSVVVVDLDKEAVYGVVSETSIDFYDAAGQDVAFSMYDQLYKSIDLTSGGDTHPSLVYNFGITYLGLNEEHYSSIAKSYEEDIVDEFPSIVNGAPSPGFDSAPSDYQENVIKAVVVDANHTYRVVIDPN